MLKTIGGYCIHQTENGIKVYQNLLYRWLTFGSTAIQTLIHRRLLEKPGLRYIHYLRLAVCAQPGNCCLLGLGGAGIAHSLVPYIGTSKLLAVENDTYMITVANDYFMSGRIKNLSILHQDANQFVDQSKERFKHMIVDLYGANTFPAHCNTTDFFANCSRLLTSDGILAVNIANGSELKPILQSIQEGFSLGTILLPVKGTPNVIILASKSTSIDSLLGLLRTNQLQKKIAWSARWGCVAEL